MTFTGSFLRGCMVCSCALSLGVMPVVAASPAADSAAVQKLAHSLKARVGMAAVMLDTGEAVAVGDETAYPMQSVFKFVLALSVLKRVDQGALNLEQIIHIRPEQLVKDTWSPLRERFPQGGDFSLKELLRVTVQESDNNTCDLLFALIGGTETVQKDLKEWGISGINVRFTEDEMLRNHELQYANSSRPSAMNALLRAFDAAGSRDAKTLFRAAVTFHLGIVVSSGNKNYFFGISIIRMLRPSVTGFLSIVQTSLTIS